MSQPNEPSMEEILSSIKRIIAEDSDSLAPRRGAPAAEPDDEPDVLELTQPWGEPEAPDQPELEPEAESIAVEEAPALASAPVAPEPEPAAPMARAPRAMRRKGAGTGMSTRRSGCMAWNVWTWAREQSTHGEGKVFSYCSFRFPDADRAR